MKGSCRFWLMDEAHKLTNDAQNALLKLLEEPPKHVYFILCTTSPGKLIPTIRNRAMHFQTKLVVDPVLRAFVQKIAEKEKFDLDGAVLEKIVEVAQGSPRAALHNLEKILTIEDQQQQLDAIRSSDVEKQAIDLCRMLIFDKPNWKSVANLLKELEEPEESIRHMVLGYARKVLLGGGKFAPKAWLVIQCFLDHWYDCGRAGLDAACYEVIQKP